jgi:hypothetical protein
MPYIANDDSASGERAAARSGSPLVLLIYEIATLGDVRLCGSVADSRWWGGRKDARVDPSETVEGSTSHQATALHASCSNGRTSCPSRHTVNWRRPCHLFSSDESHHSVSESAELLRRATSTVLPFAHLNCKRSLSRKMSLSGGSKSTTVISTLGSSLSTSARSPSDNVRRRHSWRQLL